MYAPPPMAAYPTQAAPKAPNPAGTAGFITALAGVLLYIAVVIVMMVWVFQQFNFRQMARMSPSEQARFQQRLQEKMYQDLPAAFVGMWVSMGVGVVGLVLSIVGMTRKNAKKGLAITGLVLGCLASVCAVTGAIGGLAQAFGGG